MYVEKYTVGHLYTKCDGFILIHEAMFAENVFDLPFAVN